MSYLHKKLETGFRVFSWRMTKRQRFSARSLMILALPIPRSFHCSSLHLKSLALIFIKHSKFSSPDFVATVAKLTYTHYQGKQLISLRVKDFRGNSNGSHRFLRCIDSLTAEYVLMGCLFVCNSIFTEKTRVKRNFDKFRLPGIRILASIVNLYRIVSSSCTYSISSLFAGIFDVMLLLFFLGSSFGSSILLFSFNHFVYCVFLLRYKLKDNYFWLD